MKTISVKIEDQLYSEIKAKLAKEKKTLNLVVSELMLNYLVQDNHRFK
jgi:hypothetical protein